MDAQAPGTFTFLFTDIEGSTRLLIRLGDRYANVLEDHHRLVEGEIVRFGGRVAGIEGDSFFVAFTNPLAALETAVAAQRVLFAHSWPDGVAVRVRMGLHTGGANRGPTGYTGLSVHRAARVSAAAHGGQILLSGPARSAIGQSLPTSLALRDLGKHRLKDLPDLEHLFQVEVPDLPSDFAPLRSVEAKPNNLPTVLSEFVGRSAEIATVEELIADHRLVTLTGPGGSGKTRLALRVAADSLERFPDGVFFVSLEAISSPDLVASQIVQSLGIIDTTGRSAIDILEEDLPGKHLLLVLDNFEQILPAAPMVARLCEVAPKVHALITSRALLRVRGEQRFEVPPLPVPDPASVADPTTITAIDSVALFVRRAQGLDPNFAATADNAKHISRIVSGLDGMPLAIELAAAQIRYQTPAALAARLDDSLNRLVGGPSDGPARHRTLRDAITWGYDLLDNSEREYFRRMGAFSGGFTLAAFEAISGDSATGATPALASLIDKSFVTSRVTSGEARFHLVETIRQFAVDELTAHNERSLVSERHAEYFEQLALEAEPQLAGASHAIWIERLSLEQDNLRAVLRFALEADHPDIGLRIAGAIWRYWHGAGHLREGMQWLENLLAHPAGSKAARAKALNGQAGLAYWLTDYRMSKSSYEEALALYRSIGDRYHEADALYGLSLAVAIDGEPDRGADLANQAMRLFEDLGDRKGIGNVLMAQATVHWLAGDLDAARSEWETSLEISLEDHNLTDAASRMFGLTGLQFAQGDMEAAAASASATLEMAWETGSIPMTVFGFEAVSVCAASTNPREAVRLAGAAASLRRIAGGHTMEVVGVPTARDQVRGVLNDETTQTEWEAGEQMGIDEAIQFARRVAASLPVS
jgi:predicted ATPase/class 3 adenylate cyclase